MKIFIFFLLLFEILNGKIIYKTNDFKVEELADVGTVVWSIETLDTNKLIFTEKRGKVGVLDLQSKKISYLKGVPKDLFTKGQGGLMDVATYKDTLYFTHLKKLNKQAVTTLSKANLKKNTLINWEEVLATKSGTDTGRHFGSRITFDEKHIYFSIGDRGERPNGQNLLTHAGKILRLNLDGTIPHDNPFVGKKALDEIFSYGHRNPQGLFYDKQRKKLFSNEHGPRGGDEINLIEKGNNYGWAEISYGKEYWNPLYVGEFKKAGMEQPLHQFTPSIAPSSLLIYNGDKFPQWKGSFLSGALALTHINIITFDTNFKVLKEQRILEDLGMRIRDVIEGEDGYIYFATDSGRIFRILD